MEALNIYCHFLFLLYYLAFWGANSDQNPICGPGLRTAGVTMPKGDLMIEHGNPLEIFCILNSNETHLNSSSLVFYQDNNKVTSEVVEILNETTLHLYVEHPPISSSLYSCRLQSENKEEGVCHNYVFVGTKPQPVKNFTCISYNWEALNCSWIPEKNPVHTTYRLSFSLRGKTRHIYKCPGDSDISHNYCLWNSTTNPPHRMPHDEYFFKLVGENVFGNISTKFKINQFAVVLPRKPENLTLVQATPSSLTVSWDLPLALKEFPIEIKNKVLFKSSWDPIIYWQEVNISKAFRNGETHVLNITDLKYARTLYDIRVLLRSSKAEDIEKWWSEPATITVHTKPTVPAMPPKTVIGSFESLPRASNSDLRNIFIYWQIIPRKFENGDNFNYKIISIEEVVDGKRIQRYNTPTIDKYFALFENMTYHEYIFKIVSSNKEGISQNYSTIIVPSKAVGPDHPLTFGKIAYNQGVYELSWNAPLANNVSSHNNIVNYTIFWCENKYDRPYTCNGVLNWMVVSGNVTKKSINLTVDKTYQFAISANTANSSTGMVWAHCTVFADQERGKLTNIWINRIGSDFMELKWKLDCIRSPINEFLVEYCPVPFPKHTECKDKEISQKRFNGDQYTTHYNMAGLKPYTTYKVRLSLVSTKDSLISSDVLFNTTLEAAPGGPPENIKAVNVSNNSATLSWKQPSALNGVLRHYEVYWNSSYKLIENKSEFVQFTLNQLSSYEDYVIQVTACTVACSNKSDPLVIKTQIGTPAQLNTPAVSYYNKTYLNITWFPLKYQLGGKNDYYQIKVQMLNEQKDTVLNETIKIYENPGGTQEEALEMLFPGCEEAESSSIYRVQVRAVNKDKEHSKIFEGPWSLPAEGLCHTNAIGLSAPNVVLIASVGVLLSLVLCVFIGLLAQYGWRHFKAMKNIHVKLPPQLELDNEINKYNELTDIPMNSHVCPQPKPADACSTENPYSDLLKLELEKTNKEELGESYSKEVPKEKEISSCSSGPEYALLTTPVAAQITTLGTIGDEMKLELERTNKDELGKNYSKDVQKGKEASSCSSGPEYVLSTTPPVRQIITTESDEDSEDISDPPRRDYLRLSSGSKSGDSGEGYSVLAQAPSGYVTLTPAMSNYVKHDWIPNASVEGCDFNESSKLPKDPPCTPSSNETSMPL